MMMMMMMMMMMIMMMMKVVVVDIEMILMIITMMVMQGLSRYLETGCPNRGFIDFCVSKVWYKIHTTNKINPIHLQLLLFRPDTALCVL